VTHTLKVGLSSGRLLIITKTVTSFVAERRAFETACLWCRKNRGLTGEVYQVSSQGQGFRNPASGVMQDAAKSPHLAWEVLRGR
jgi:hypothetical protein